MSTKTKKASAASLRRHEIERHRKAANQCLKMVKFELNKAPKMAGTTLLALVVDHFDPKSEYVQIFHPGGPPGPARIAGSILIG